MESVTMRPTEEQDNALTLFGTGGSLKVNAYAGTGKTTTLEMLANSTKKAGQFLAFNKAIVADAKKRFPYQTSCSTVHSLAFRATVHDYDSPAKLMDRLSANQVAQLLALQPWWVLDDQHMLTAREQGYLVLAAVTRFCHSRDEFPMPHHVPMHGRLITASDAVRTAVRVEMSKLANTLWERMVDRRDTTPLGHDGYVKVWALGRPRIAADFILLDEAQDTNPVVLGVMEQQDSQLVYVGDRYQQIYEWRGAINAMEVTETDHTSYLTQSFRFGEDIASYASRILSVLGETRPLLGNPAKDSRIGELSGPADAILSRTNAAVMSSLIDSLDQGLDPHVVGGTKELKEMLYGVTDLKDGRPSTVPEFFGFATWTEVLDFSQTPEGEDLISFVNLVQTRGEKQLQRAVALTVTEDRSNIVVSTAHRAKGREWDRVRLTSDFLGSKKRIGPPSREDLQVFYVAATRGRVEMEIPPAVMAVLEGGDSVEEQMQRDDDNLAANERDFQ